MPRQTRLGLPGVLRHVMGRGIERRRIFSDDAGRLDFRAGLAVVTAGVPPPPPLLWPQTPFSRGQSTIESPAPLGPAVEFRRSSRPRLSPPIEEMNDERQYDLSRAVRGKFYREGAELRLPIYLDA